MLSMDQGGGGAPKPNKASKKGKKSWRKNVDMKVKPPLGLILNHCCDHTNDFSGRGRRFGGGAF